MSRFQIENIRAVSTTYNPEHDAVEFCAIEGPRGVVHWLTEEEEGEVRNHLKSKAKGEYVTRQDQAFQEAKAEAEELRRENTRLQDLIAESSKALKRP